MSKSLSIYAVPADLTEVLCELESVREIQYTLAGLSDREDAVTFASVQEIGGFGICQKGDQNQVPTYLISKKGSRLVRREVLQRNKTVMYALDQILNPSTVALRPGGKFGENCVIAGQIGTATEDPVSLEVFGFIGKLVRRRFRRLRSFWVGEGALSILHSGGRLTTNVKSTHEYDLRD